jgi:hypothetical protein
VASQLWQYPFVLKLLLFLSSFAKMLLPYFSCRKAKKSWIKNPSLRAQPEAAHKFGRAPSNSFLRLANSKGDLFDVFQTQESGKKGVV